MEKKNTKKTGTKRNTKKRELQLLICTHKDFRVPDDIANNKDMYTIIQEEDNEPVQDAKGVELLTLPANPLTHAWNEHSNLSGFLHQVKPKAKYTGLCHYRRYFDVDDFSTLLKDYDGIACTYNCGTSIYNQYRGCHNIKDLIEVMDIITDLHPEYKEAVDSIQKEGTLYICNMVVLPTDKFVEWATFVHSVLDLYDRRHNFNSDADVRAYVEANIDQYTNKDIDYQSRLQGFLSERIGHIWLKHNCPNLYGCRVRMM